MSMTCMFNCFTNAWDTVIFARASWFRFIRSWWCLMLLHLHEIIILLLLILHKFTMFSLNIPPCCTCCGLALFQSRAENITSVRWMSDNFPTKPKVRATCFMFQLTEFKIENLPENLEASCFSFVLFFPWIFEQAHLLQSQKLHKMTLKQYINVEVSAQTAENTGELLPQIKEANSY